MTSLSQKQLKCISNGTKNLKKSSSIGKIVIYDDLENIFDEIDQTRINILQDISQNEKHLEHPINVMFRDYNEFIQLVFRTSRLADKEIIENIPLAVAAGSKLGIELAHDDLLPTILRKREH